MRVQLEPGLDWAGAIAACRRERGMLERDLGLRLEGHPVIEVDERGRPKAYLPRLVGDPPDSLPKGWVLSPPSSGLTVRVGSPARVTAALLGELSAAVPRSARPGTAYLRLDPGDGGEVFAQLVLPLQPR